MDPEHGIRNPKPGTRNLKHDDAADAEAWSRVVLRAAVRHPRGVQPETYPQPGTRKPEPRTRNKEPETRNTTLRTPKHDHASFYELLFDILHPKPQTITRNTKHATRNPNPPHPHRRVGVRGCQSLLLVGRSSLSVPRAQFYCTGSDRPVSGIS